MSKKKVIFYIGEIVLLIFSFYTSILFVYPYIIRLFIFTSQNAYDFFTPMAVSLVVSFIVVAVPLTSMWYFSLFGKTSLKGVFRKYENT